MDLTDLYRDVILDHNRSPRNFGRLDPADAAADGHNALCGDKLHVTLNLHDGKLSDIRFDGQGCAISVASASLMSEAVKGLPRAEVESLYQEIHSLLTEQGHVPGRNLGKLMALAGVREFPARVKCASLCWHTLHAALGNAALAAGAAAAPVTTE
jgi:nitrogen fixation NifU-like protein